MANISLDLKTVSLTPGNHTLRMKLSDNNQTKLDSDFSNSVTYNAVYYNYTLHLTNCHTYGGIPVTGQVRQGGTLTVNIVANENYTLTGATVAVLVGGIHHEEYWDDGILTIPNVNGIIDVSITAAEIVSYVAVTRNLIGCESTQTTPPTQTLKGQQYQESFVASSSSYDLDEATVHISVGGTELLPTSSYWVYNNNVGTVTIPANKVTGDITMSIQAAEAGTWSVDIDGISEHLTKSNNSRTVQKNASYSNIIGTTTGWQIQQSGVSITMGGTDITSSAWQTSGNIYIGAVTGNLVITVPATAIPQTIDATLNNCSGDNDATSVDYNDPYVNHLTATTGYTFNGVTPTILMDDEPVAGAWTVGADGTTATINIAHVTGFVEIIVTAEQETPPPETVTIYMVLTDCTRSDTTRTYPLSWVYGEAYSNYIQPTDFSAYNMDTAATKVEQEINGEWVDITSRSEISLTFANLSIYSLPITHNTRITAVATKIKARVSRTLQHCTGSNTSAYADIGGSYENTITASTGYSLNGNITVSVKMGGVDITSSAWNVITHKISISEVTDDIAITVSAVTAYTVSVAQFDEGALARYSVTGGRSFLDITKTGTITATGSGQIMLLVKGTSTNACRLTSATLGVDITSPAGASGFTRSENIFLTRNVDDITITLES